mmetsp:Transcript_24933/g.67327  ORF Transcript_24933/g.67327 Transcript_24933/m.67327 type:complete len:80 (-) Transcript_24933:118-357(-)|eukprot:CAMPEP_0119485186 /NCGR_PEP_ID=MMETSP1344-20130328/11974_1 /TAXON_ID=236787 /ORGANISM="Florenciella parvula, Strain CCMP2471" /LENGTH=79 /DNA_ID=CAMNT_0007519833 /DNA_START=158 /DNA_END=397 /DNA_ORIENTATION=+
MATPGRMSRRHSTISSFAGTSTLVSLAALVVRASAGTAPFAAGCGSNVVDRFFRVRAIPKAGEKVSPGRRELRDSLSHY